MPKVPDIRREEYGSCCARERLLNRRPRDLYRVRQTIIPVLHGYMGQPITRPEYGVQWKVEHIDVDPETGKIEFVDTVNI